MVAVEESLPGGKNMFFESSYVCVVAFAMCGVDRSPPTPPVAPDSTNIPPDNAEHMELPESADSIGMEFKQIPAGTFVMGDASGKDDETPHEVTLTKPFKIGVHEVKQIQYEQVMGVNPSYNKGENRPVDKVN